MGDVEQGLISFGRDGAHCITGFILGWHLKRSSFDAFLILCTVTHCNLFDERRLPSSTLRAMSSKNCIIARVV